MVGGWTGRVKAALVLLVVLAACFWRTYGRAAATHADLLVALAHKGVDLVAGGRFTAESMPELTYPLERGQAFVRTAEARSGEGRPASLVALEDLLTRYQRFVDALDRVRRTESGADAERALAEPLHEVEAARDAVHAALRSEGRL